MGQLIQKTTSQYCAQIGFGQRPVLQQVLCNCWFPFKSRSLFDESELQRCEITISSLLSLSASELLSISLSLLSSCSTSCRWRETWVSSTSPILIKALAVTRRTRSFFLPFNWRLKWLTDTCQAPDCLIAQLYQRDKECSNHSPRSISVVSACLSCCFSLHFSRHVSVLVCILSCGFFSIIFFWHTFNNTILCYFIQRAFLDWTICMAEIEWQCEACSHYIYIFSLSIFLFLYILFLPCRLPWNSSPKLSTGTESNSEGYFKYLYKDLKHERPK